MTTTLHHTPPAAANDPSLDRPSLNEASLAATGAPRPDTEETAA
jgi:hypothetical protein